MSHLDLLAQLHHTAADDQRGHYLAALRDARDEPMGF